MSDSVFDYLIALLRYSKEAPLNFTTPFFWGFFCLVFVLFAQFNKRVLLRNAFLFAVSIFFYYKTSGLYFLLLLLTVFSDFMIGKRMELTVQEGKRKALLALSVTLNLGILFYFKYAYFFTETYNELFGTSHEVLNLFAQFTSSFTGEGSLTDRILLPVGISFYTFQAISYTADIYKRKLKPLQSIIDFGFYVSFFPQLVAGPIVRASEFIPQMFKPYVLSKYSFGLALFLILTGLLKKMVVGDYMAVHFIDKIFAAPETYPGFASLMAVLCYSLQVYMDFSGYTDIAIGIALLMGFRFNTNFNSPYKAQNTAEFWKRWHISLSTWLKDYLYIPLGGNKKGSIGSYLIGSLLLLVFLAVTDFSLLAWIVVGLCIFFVLLGQKYAPVKKQVDTNINLMITMLLGGFWHGSTWNFIVWGGLNGLGLIVYKYWKRISPYEHLKWAGVRVWKIALTFSFISFTRIWFRSADKETANAILHKLWYDMDWSLATKILGAYPQVFMIFLTGMVIHWLPLHWKRNYRLWFVKSNVFVKIALICGVVFIIWQTITAESVPFIYFQF